MGRPGAPPRAVVLGLIAAGMLVPVTLPVPVLRGLVLERFGVTDTLAAIFMSINMVGAMLAAPLAGALADRIGRRKALIAGALALDSVCFLALTLDAPFPVFLAIRFLEGCAHITALSLLLSLAADVGRTQGTGRTMGFVGGGITLGVAAGAPLGGQLGRIDVLAPLEAGAAISALLAVLVAVGVRDVAGRVERPGLRVIAAAVRRNTALLVPLAYAFVDRFTVGFFTTTFTFWMRGVHDLAPDRIGMLLGLFLGPFALLSYPFGRLSERASRVAMLAGGSTLYGLGLASLGLWSIEILPAVMVLLGVTSAVMFVPSLILTVDLSTTDARSTALGGFNAAGSLGFMLGPLFGAQISERVAAATGDWHTGYGAAFAAAGVAELLCVAVTFGALRRLRAQQRTT